MQGVGDARNGVCKTRRRVGANPQLAGDAAPRVGHVHRRLLMSGIDEPEILVYHHVQQGQNVIPRQREDIRDAFQFQGFANEMAAGNYGHNSSLFLAGTFPSRG